jgi:hypothetical protein
MLVQARSHRLGDSPDRLNEAQPVPPNRSGTFAAAIHNSQLTHPRRSYLTNKQTPGL